MRYFIAPAFIGTILLANWLTTRYGFVPVGFGQMAIAGTYAAGLALALRDGVQDLLGKRVMLTTLALGAGLSFAVADARIAVASAVAFAVSELADFGIYTPLRERGRFGSRWWAIAVLASGLVAAVVDTAIFVGLAFGAAAIMPAMAGQLIGKTWAALAYLLIGKVVALRVGDRTVPA